MKRMMCAACGEPWDGGAVGCCGPCDPVEVEDKTLVTLSMHALEDGNGTMQMEYPEGRPVEEVCRGLEIARGWIDQEINTLERRCKRFVIPSRALPVAIDSETVD
ncbi:MAG: hypothetical protein AB7I98_03935 [Verrucomicrobiales bacterium]